jgi:hypothetical protein
VALTGAERTSNWRARKKKTAYQKPVPPSAVANDDGKVIYPDFRDGRPERYYARVPLSAMRALDPKTRVFIAICYYTDEEGEAYPAHKKISEKTGLDRRTVRKSIDLLKREGLLEQQHQYRDNDGKSSNLYTVIGLKDGARQRHEVSARQRQEDGAQQRHGDGAQQRHGGGAQQRHGEGAQQRHVGEDISLEQKETEQRAGERARLRDDWKPDADGIQLALSFGYDPIWLLEKFKDHHLSKGTRNVDWQAAWRMWCRREAEHDGNTPEPASEPATAVGQEQKITYRENPDGSLDDPRAQRIWWQDVIKELRKTGIWDHAWGPPPDDLDTKMPLAFRKKQVVINWLTNNSEVDS